MTLAIRARRTHMISQRTHSTRNHLPLEKPLCCIVLLYKEEEWQTAPYTRLLTSECLDHQKSLPTPPHFPANQLTQRVHPLYRI